MDEIELLHGLAATAVQPVIVEIGSYRGRSTLALASGASPRTAIYAVDPHEPFEGVLGGSFGPEDRAAFYRTMRRSGAWRNVRLVNLPSDVAAAGWPWVIGFLFIDGDHTLEGIRRDWAAWSPHLAARARVAFDDATGADLGPFQLIDQLLASGSWREVDGTGKIRVLERARANQDQAAVPWSQSE